MARHSITTLLSALLLGSTANALGPPGQRGRNLVEVFREQYIKGEGGVNLYPPERNEPELEFVTSNTTNSTLTQEYVELPIDHFAECSDTYMNRYWVQEKYYEPGGPVFIYDSGESNAASDVSWMRGESFFTDLLKEFGGMGIVWEHRFYGKSYPLPKDNRTFLTVEQALADIPTMAAKFSRPHFSHIDLTPASTPWVFIGASYPGVRAAYSRAKYPNTFHASWAASAPVEARADMSVYWSPIIPGMKALGFGGCLSDIQAANKRMEYLLANNATAVPLKQRFFGNSGASMSDHEFAYSLSSLFFSWQVRLAAGSIERFCNFLTNETAPSSGWAPSKGADWIIDRMANARSWTEVSPVYRDNNDMSWMWQYCTQFGFLQGSGPELDHLIIKYNSVAWLEALCQKAFPNEIPSWPQTKKLNNEFGGWDMRPSNVFWSGGEFDPWRTLQPLSGLPHAPEVEVTTEIPSCGVATPQSQIFGQVLPKAAHGYEFSNREDAIATQKLFAKALKTWLPCFQKKPPSNIRPHTPGKCPQTRQLSYDAHKVPIMNAKRSVQFTA